LIPNVLREFAELNKDVVLIGVASRIEIWSRERFEDATACEDMDEIAEHMAELGLGI
jgi:MraZ protein